MAMDEDVLLLKIFPAEIWLLILEHVKDAKHYQKFCGTSHYFRSLLFPRATQLLFPAVAQLIRQRDQGNLSKILLPHHVTRYRQVCKAWREGLDSVLQTQHFNPHFPSDYDKFSGIFESCVKKTFEKFCWPGDFSQFEEHFDSTHYNSPANPVLCRGVAFVFGGLEYTVMPENYYPPCIQFLEKYGFHIWACVIRYPRFRGRDYEFYQNLKVLLKLMPNLKSLKVEVFPWDSEEPLPLQRLLEADLPKNPFPTSPHLCFLTISGVHVTAVEALLQANPQVEHADASNECSPDVLKVLLTEAKMLKGLALQPWCLAQLDAICKANVTAPVENLWLDATRIPENFVQLRHYIRFQHYEYIFNAIKFPFSQSLKQLRVRLPSLRVLLSDGELALPHLQILELEMEELVPLDFLLPLRDTLEHLSVTRFSSYTKYRMERRDQSTVKLCEFWERPEMSNVWELFPKLKLLTTADARRSGRGLFTNDVSIKETRRQRWTIRQLE